MSTVWGYRKGEVIAVYKHHLEAIHDYPEGIRLRIKIDKDRNGKYNSLFHLMLDKVARAVNRGPAKTDVDTLKQWVKLQRGWYDVVLLPVPMKGQTHAIDYHSTSFAKMGEAEFHQFAVQACDLIRDELAPWISASPEWVEVQNIVNSISPSEQAA